MLKNNLKLSLRNIKTHQGYSFINIFGLTVAMTVCILVYIYINYELSFDKYHNNEGNIYRVVTRQEGNKYKGTDLWAVTPALLGETLKNDFPEVIKASRATFQGSQLLGYGNKKFEERGILFADPDFLDIMTCSLISGDPSTVLKEPFSILLSQQMKKKYFGNIDPLGKVLIYKKKFPLKVKGVFKDLPENSHLQFDFIASISSLPTIIGGDFGRKYLNRWNSLDFTTYIKLQKNIIKNVFEKKFPGFEKKYSRGKHINRFFLQPVNKIHLYSKYNFDIASNSDIKYLFILASIAFFIMLIASFNYMNLATARSIIRSREVGVRKVIGAFRGDLIKQFYTETFFHAFLSFLFSLLLVIILLPFFNSLVERNLSFNFIRDLNMFFGIIGIFIFIALISGIYPALFLSSFKPDDSLRGKFNTGSKFTSIFRDSLVVFQFIISILLITGTFIIFNQLKFIKNKDLGFQKNHIINTRIKSAELRKNIKVFKSLIASNPDITGLSSSSSLPSYIGSGGSGTKWEGKKEDENLVFYRLFGDMNFLELYKMQIIKGRSFSNEFPSDEKSAYILNETAVKSIGWKNPIGKRFNLGGDREGIVIGVIKDFHYQPLNLKILPIWIKLKSKNNYYLSIKIRSENISSTINYLKNKWKKFSPDFPFSYSFMDERIDRMYRSEQNIFKILTYLSFLALLLAGFGLVGLASFNSEQKAKEIGIRKTLGASNQNILYVLSKKYLKFVIYSSLLALPVGFYLMTKWLNNFVYRIDLSPHLFYFPILTVLMLIVLSIGYHSLAASRANPIDIIRS